MRGFGVLGVDFAIERQMDKGARAAGLGPMEFRLINAYRDGDMKATRRVASNTALVECIKVAAQKANYRLSANYEEMTSMTGASQTEIPETVTESGVLPAGYSTVPKTNTAEGLAADTVKQVAKVNSNVPVDTTTQKSNQMGASALAETKFGTSSTTQQNIKIENENLFKSSEKQARSRYSRYSSAIRRR